MEVHIIKVSKDKNSIQLPEIVEMESIPRIGESITFVPTTGGNTHTVTNVDYSIKENRQWWVRVWVDQ